MISPPAPNKKVAAVIPPYIMEELCAALNLINFRARAAASLRSFFYLKQLHRLCPKCIIIMKFNRFLKIQ